MVSRPLGIVVAGAIALVLTGSQATGSAARAGDSPQVLALVNGKAITEADVRSANADQLSAIERQYQKQLRELIEGGLEQAINDRLAEAEAAARGTTVEEVLGGIQSPPVTDADVDAFYEENKSQIPRPKEQVADQIKGYLEGMRQQQARTDFFKGLEGKYKVEMKLEPVRVSVAATGPSRGPATAPVTIVEFSDFQCPFCQRLLPSLDEVRAKYGDKVRIVFRQYPLSMHQNAQKAAEAALCAHEQGKFWELHDAMFADQNALGVEQLKATAAALGLEADAFNSCLDSGKSAAAVQADLKDGAAAGVDGTPAMFVNGRFLNGAVPLEQISRLIDDELRRHGG